MVLIVIMRLFFSAKAVLTAFGLGFILAYILDPLVNYLEAKRIPRSFAIVLIYLILGVLIMTLLMQGIPVLFRDLHKMLELIPSYTESVQEMLYNMEKNYSRVQIPDSVKQVIDETILQLQRAVLAIGQSFVQGLLFLFSQTFNLVLAPIISFYFLKDFAIIGQMLQKVIPARFRPETDKIGREINHVIKKFIRGNLLVACLVALLTSLGMYLIGMEFPVLLGILAGITNFIPYFGAFIAAVPIVLLALVKSKWLALYAVGLMFLIQQIEGNILAPKILGDCVGLHPLVLIFALLMGGQLWGIWGLVLAVPLAAILKIVCRHLYLHLI